MFHVPRSVKFFQLTSFICDNYNNNSSHTLITLPQIDLIIVSFLYDKSFYYFIIIIEFKMQKHLILV